MFKKVDIKKISIKNGEKNIEKIEDFVADEKDVILVVNGRRISVFKISPEKEKEFGIGYCLCEGIVEKIEYIDDVKIKGRYIIIKAKKAKIPEERFMSSDCIGVVRFRADYKTATSNFKVEKDKIFEYMKKMQKESVVWRKTGGVHTSAIVYNDNMIVVEDISRHVAVDKVIGEAFLRGFDPEKSIILTSGRVPGDMVAKVARVGIPIIVSRTAPLYTGVLLAEKLNLTLVGFTRGKRMNIYTHEWRIII